MNGAALTIKLSPATDSRIVLVRGTTRRTVICQSEREAKSLADELKAFELTVEQHGSTLAVA